MAFFPAFAQRSSPCRDACEGTSRAHRRTRTVSRRCSTLDAECCLTVCLVTACEDSRSATFRVERHTERVEKRARSSACRAAAARTSTSLSRLATPRVRISVASGVASSRERTRINRSFAAPSTGGADTRTSSRPSRTWPKPSGDERGRTRRCRIRSAPCTAHQEATLSAGE